MFSVFRTATPGAPAPTLEGYAQGAGCALVCDFSSSDEFEAALIAERRAAGRYRPKRHRKRMAAYLLAATLALAIIVALAV